MKVHITVLVTVCVLSAVSSVEDYESRKCLHYRGVCTKVVNCPRAVKSLKKNGIIDLPKCGFSGFDELVCCPKPTNVTTEAPIITESRFGGLDDCNCIRTVECKPAVDMLRRKMRPKFKNCGWLQNQELLCCPLPKLDNTKEVSTNSDLACDALKKELDQAYISAHHITQLTPHIAHLGFINQAFKVTWQCEGALISPKFILTSASCVFGNNVASRNRWKVQFARLGFGPSDTFDYQKDFQIENIEAHKSYSSWARQNDLAMVELKEPVAVRSNLFWSCLSNEDPDNSFLKSDNLTLLSKEECRRQLLKGSDSIFDDKYIFCLRTNFCEGPKGHPIQKRNQMDERIFDIIGVNVYTECEKNEAVEVYIKVAAYKDWIESVINKSI